MLQVQYRMHPEIARFPAHWFYEAKLRNSLVLRELSNLALDLEGAEGLTGASEWQTLFLTGPSFGIRGGTDEIQRNIMGERVLGLPPEPRVDKGHPFAGGS